MANAKANIYPVQLQGAELNLNKFDAEIKQYSGFNKNNSPFVGGCLSNVFLKNEANATESSDSVYVDDEGNRYELKLDPNNDNRPTLFKNNEPVIEYKNESDYSLRGWTSKKLDLPKTTVFYDVAVENYQIVADFRIESLETDSDTVLTRLKYTYRDFLNDTTITDYLDVVTPDTSSKNNYAIVKTFYYWKRVNADEVSFGFKMYARDIVNDVGYVVMKVKPFKTNYSDMLREWTVSYTGGQSDYFYNRYNSFCYHVSNGSYIFFSNVAYGCKYFPSDTTQDPVMLYAVTLFLHTPFSDITVLDNLSFLDVFINSDKIYITSDFPQDQISNQRIVIAAPYTSISLYVPRPGAGTALRVDITVNDSNINECILTQPISINHNTFDMGRVNNAYWLRDWGCCYGLRAGTARYYWGVCDYITGSITLEDNDSPMFKIGALCGGGVLINNGNISGLSLPGGTILVSDWNTVADNIVIGGRSGKDFKYIIYQDTSGDYYMVSCLENKLQLKEINGLLVTNINRTQNCYRLSDGKVLTFAPAWNNRAPKNNVKTYTERPTNDYYLASAINEYNLKDNASIILNPVPVISDKITDLRIPNFNSNIEKYCINFYTGSINSNEFLYVCSSDIENDKYYFNVDLKDMPFPLDTNGNVQYSPSLFCETFSSFGNDVFIKQGNAAYQLMKVDSEAVMSFYLGTLVEGLEDVFVIQGQYYGIINNQIFAITFANGVVQSMTSIVSTVGLQFCGNSPYMAIFFSKTNRCLYSFTGANVLNKLQFVDKISEIKGYKYNPATQSIFLLTDIGLVISSLFGMYSLESQWNKLFVYDKGIALVNDTNITWLEYYAREGFEKQLIELETCFYGMNNQTVTINDCLYVRLFSEEHEEGSIKVTATTISNSGRKTEQTEFKIKKSDWDKLTDSIYLRYQPKEQRGLGISFSISSPFKIASLSIGSQADAILIDKVSKGAINAPQVTSSNIKW